MMPFMGYNGLPANGVLLPRDTRRAYSRREYANIFGKLPRYGTDETPLDGAITETIDKVLQEDNTMEMGNFMQGMFGPVKGGLCRLTVDGNIAIKVPGGYKTYNPAQKAFINCDSFVFDIGDEMFFVIPTNTVAIGDIIMVGGEPRYVLKVADDMITCINYKSGTVENIMPERHMFMGNTYFYGKIMSLFGNMGGVLGGGEGAQNAMKFMMMKQMCQGMGGKDTGMNPMMMMMLMNGGGMNMFDNLFKAANPVIPTPAPTTEVKEGE